MTKGPWVAVVALQITEEEMRGFDVITGHGIPDCTFPFLFHCNESNLNWRRIELVLTTFKQTALQRRGGRASVLKSYTTVTVMIFFYHFSITYNSKIFFHNRIHNNHV